MAVKSNRGAALLFALTALSVIAVLAGALVAAVLHSSARGRSAASREAALNRAESGIEIAIEKLAADSSWRSAKAASVPGGHCMLTVRSDGKKGYHITSTAAPRSSGAASAAWTGVLKVQVQPATGGKFRIVSWDLTWR